MQPFVSTDELGAYIRRDVTGDLMAEIAIGTACETLRDFLGQVIDAVVDDVVMVRSGGTDCLLLPELPVVNVTKVEIRGRTDATNRVVDPTTYWVDLQQGMIYIRNLAGPGGTLGGNWVRGQAAYQVTYSHGWVNPMLTSGSGGSGGVDDADFEPIPRTLRGLALKLAARILEQGLVKAETVGMYQSIYSADDSLGFTKVELDILAKYQPGRIR